jgi:hypothetical protein
VTNESLVPADTESDVYMRQNGVTTLISDGPAGGHSSVDNAIFDGISNDGSVVYFSTTESLVPADTDTARDVYQWKNGVVTLVSDGPAGGSGAVDAFYSGNSADGSKVWFETTEKLTSDENADGFQDIYQWSNGTTTLVSPGPTGGSAPSDAFYLGHSDDGSHVYFQTAEAAVPSDTDGFQDIYDRSGGTTTLVSTGPAGQDGPVDASFGGATPDGSHIYFMTKEQLTSDDTDTDRDVYDRSGGTTTRVSTGPNDSNGTGPYNANFVGASQDGSKVWFETREPLVATDTDGGCPDANVNPVLPCTDVYERSGGNTTLISTGPNGGNGPYEASFAGASQDGSKVFFRTAESLTADDTDQGYQDIYQRSGGTTTLISTGPNNGNGHDAFWGGASADGARVFFQTNGSLVPADTDGGYQDVYERYAGGTNLISTGPTSTNAPISAFYDGSSQDGTVVFFDTSERLTSADTDSTVDLYSSTQTFPGAPRPKGASPLSIPLVPAYRECTTGNTTHGAPLSNASCKPPTLESGVLTLGTPDVNARPSSSVSSVKLTVVPGPPTDVRVATSVTDVFCATTNAACPNGPLSQYTGKLLVAFRVRMTDKYNGSPLQEAATSQDFDVQVPVQCVTVTGALQGATCQAVTTINSLYPGAILGGKRAVWELNQGRLLDAGPNGTGYDSGCPPTCGDGDETVFMRQGIFAP